MILDWIEFFLIAAVALGYVVGHLYPIEQLRAALQGRHPPPVDGLRQALRIALRAPAGASDEEMIAVIAAMHQVEELDARLGALPAKVEQLQLMAQMTLDAVVRKPQG